MCVFLRRSEMSSKLRRIRAPSQLMHLFTFTYIWDRANGGVKNGVVIPESVETNTIGQICAEIAEFAQSLPKFAGNKRRCKSIVFAKFARN